MRKPIIVGNWKMYKSIGQAIELANGLKREFFQIEPEDIDIVLCPVYTCLSEVAEVIANSNISLGGQDVYWLDEGAFTGEVSAPMLKDAGCSYVVIGHSERRQFFGETNETVNKKVKAVLKHGLTPIVCVGESLAQREANKTFEVLADHVQNGLVGLNEEEVSKIVIAYEPVWAIGTGKTATSAQAQEAHKYIRDLLVKLYNQDIADGIRIQYGGSVKPENIEEIMAQPDVDGALVGGASLKVESFSEIIKRGLKAKVEK
jgi:triosephosphate isomerase